MTKSEVLEFDIHCLEVELDNIKLCSLETLKLYKNELSECQTTLKEIMERING